MGKNKVKSVSQQNSHFVLIGGLKFVFDITFHLRLETWELGILDFSSVPTFNFSFRWWILSPSFKSSSQTRAPHSTLHAPSIVLSTAYTFYIVLQLVTVYSLEFRLFYKRFVSVWLWLCLVHFHISDLREKGKVSASYCQLNQPISHH